MYLVNNTSGQIRYPKGTNRKASHSGKFFVIDAVTDFAPSAVIFSSNQRGQIVFSDIGIFLWIASVVIACYYRGFAEVFRVYLVPYLW